MIIKSQMACSGPVEEEVWVKKEALNPKADARALGSKKPKAGPLPLGGGPALGTSFRG
jgi:hypothetical protein